jgi:catechol 2,3-dioxygenase-like lactoylglutathione lyase family enzyme
MTPTTQAKDVRLTKIAMVILYAKDPIQSLGFYRDVLGMKVKEESPEWVELDGGGVSLALHKSERVPAKRVEHEPWVVFGVEDVRAAHEALQAKGVRFLRPLTKVCGDDTYSGLCGDFTDPDGNWLSIFGTVPV